MTQTKPAIRHHYEQLGAQGFYEQHGADYRNPHEAAIDEGELQIGLAARERRQAQPAAQLQALDVMLDL